MKRAFFEKSARFFMRDSFLAAFSGVLVTAAFPSIGLEWLAWIALVPLLAVVYDRTPKQGFAAGMIAGIAHYTTLLYWIVPTLVKYGGLPFWVSLLLLLLLSGCLAAFIGVFCATISALRGSKVVGALAAPVVWTALEYLRTFLFTGFPWGLLGYSQHRFLVLIQVADITGVYGISFLVVFANAIFATMLSCLHGGMRQAGSYAPFSRYALLVSVFLALLGGSLVYGRIRLGSVEEAMIKAPKLKVSLLQGNISQDHKWDNAFRIATLEKYIDLARAAARLHPDLIVTPETAMPFYFLYDRQGTAAVIDCARETGAWLLVGAPAAVTGTRTRYYNSAYLITPGGDIAGRYDKAHLVPFGEYVPLGPLRDLFPFVEKLVSGAVGDFSAGERGRVLNMGGKGRLGVQVCYEIIFPQEAKACVKNGATLLANITNDAWYSRSSAPYQHFSMVAFRAVENRRSVVRAANTGISGFIAPTGRVTAKTDIFVEAVETAQVPLLETRTFYCRHGDLFAILCTVGMFFFLWYIYRPVINVRKRKI